MSNNNGLGFSLQLVGKIFNYFVNSQLFIAIITHTGSAKGVLL